ncbi:hypothetical protein BaRGS_00036686 [Batillaria attramentaria]|uniref:Uncharacterized protein n=1 Tax=Batillaria attramentaria TaxID=370345 RepID=A0ABD0JBD5_9CAEN
MSSWRESRILVRRVKESELYPDRSLKGPQLTADCPLNPFARPPSRLLNIRLITALSTMKAGIQLSCSSHERLKAFVVWPPWGKAGYLDTHRELKGTALSVSVRGHLLLVHHPSALLLEVVPGGRGSS